MAAERVGNMHFLQGLQSEPVLPENPSVPVLSRVEQVHMMGRCEVGVLSARITPRFTARERRVQFRHARPLFCLCEWREIREQLTACGLCSAALVAMVKPADLGERYDVALFGRLHGPGFRTVHTEGQMGPRPVVVFDVARSNSSQVCLAQYNPMEKPQQLAALPTPRWGAALRQSE